MSHSQYEPHEPAKSRVEQATDIGHQALDQATEAASVVRDTATEHPITTLALVGGVALEIGALWTLQRSSKLGHADTLMERLSDLQQHLPKKWRV